MRFPPLALKDIAATPLLLDSSMLRYAMLLPLHTPMLIFAYADFS